MDPRPEDWGIRLWRESRHSGVVWRSALTMLVLFSAGLMNGTMDSLQFHFARTPFSDATRFDQQFWNPAQSWRNKYREGNPQLGERFPGSSSVFVLTTDAWHLAKSVMLLCFVLAVVIFQPITRRTLGEPFPYPARPWVLILAANAAAFLVLRSAFHLGFWLSYY